MPGRVAPRARCGHRSGPGSRQGELDPGRRGGGRTPSWRRRRQCVPAPAPARSRRGRAAERAAAPTPRRARGGDRRRCSTRPARDAATPRLAALLRRCRRRRTRAADETRTQLCRPPSRGIRSWHHMWREVLSPGVYDGLNLDSGPTIVAGSGHGQRGRPVLDPSGRRFDSCRAHQRDQRLRPNQGTAAGPGIRCLVAEHWQRRMPPEASARLKHRSQPGSMCGSGRAASEVLEEDVARMSRPALRL